MAYERNSFEGIHSWIVTEVSSTGWNASSIAKGLTEDVMTMLGNHVNEFDSRIKQGLLLAILNMRKSDILLLNNDIKKIIEGSLEDSNEFVDIIAHILEPYPTNQQLNTKVDTWSPSFQTLVENIGSKISNHGFKCHPLEDMSLQLNARQAPQHAASTYMDFKPTHVQHFTLTTNTDDLVSSEERLTRFKEIVESEERNKQAEAQAAQVVAKKRAGVDLTGAQKRPAISPTAQSKTFQFPPISPGGVVRPPPPRSMAAGGQASSLFNKRAARPAPGGGLFINKPKPTARPIQRSNSLTNNLPRGLQREKKTQMLDFNAATEMEQNNANAIKLAQDHIKAQQEAKKQEAQLKKQEALEMKRRLAEEKREKDEARKAARATALRESREAKEAAKLALEKQREEDAKSPTSLPTSPKTPISPLSPKLKYEHVFAVPLPPNQQQQEEEEKGKKLTTF